MDTTGIVVWILCVGGAATLFTGIGIYAMHRKDPMWFWAGSTVQPESITDIPAYNRENGWMWIIYSVPFWLGVILGWRWPKFGGVTIALACTVGIAWLIWRYQRILKKYQRY